MAWKVDEGQFFEMRQSARLLIIQWLGQGVLIGLWMGVGILVWQKGLGNLISLPALLSVLGTVAYTYLTLINTKGYLTLFQKVLKDNEGSLV